jgi:hypothetical protein
MTEHELRVTYGMVYQCLSRERKMRERVFAQKPAELKRKLREIDDAMAALVVMKDELKRHVEESPEQVMLIDDLPSVQRGGY